ncbi:hypothetical protein M8C21_003359, partial [Ambrosia artemisiifolia]
MHCREQFDDDDDDDDDRLIGRLNGSKRKTYEEGVVPVDPPAPALGEPMDIMTTLHFVLRKSLAHGGLVRELHEAAKVIEKHAALLCVLAEDCNQPDYQKLVKAGSFEDSWRVGWTAG